jgi:serine/threonine-protein kinase
VVASSGAVPRLIGLDLDAARRELTALGYRVGIADAREHASAPRGTVIAQDPPPGVAMAAGGTVSVTPSAGPVQAPVPDLVGLDVALAERILQAAGLRVGVIDSVADRGADLGVVLGTRPSAGAGRRAGDAVDLIINGRER